MSDLVDNARRHIESLVTDLEGEDDFMPFMTMRSSDGAIVYVGLDMPEEEEGKDFLADTMLALCVIHRTTEVVFVSVSWLVEGHAARTGIPPSESMDRIEVVFLHQMCDDGSITFFTAPVIRKNNTVRLGEWSSNEGAAVGGRFGDAIRRGIDLGKSMPPDLCEFMDAEITAGREVELVQSLRDMWCTARAEVLGE